MRLNRFSLLLAAVGWVLVGAADARDTRHEKFVRGLTRPAVLNQGTVDLVVAHDDGPGDPSDCERHCAENAEQVFHDCREPAPDGTPGGTWQECAAKAHEFLERCLRDACSHAPSCREACREQAETAFELCRAPPRNGSWDDCAREAHSAFETCVAANCPPPPPPPPSCEDVCKRRAMEFFHTCVDTCVTAGGTEETCRAECGPEAREKLRTCLETECGIVPSCEEVCRRRAGECLAGGRDPAECRLALEACLADECGHGPSCEEQCRGEAETRAAACMGLEGDAKEQCWMDVHAVLEACLRDRCGHVPSCEEECRMAGADAFRECFIGDPHEMMTCAMAAMQEVQSCLRNCGVPPPTCAEGCRRDASAAAAQCMHLPLPEIQACSRRVEEELHACLSNCRP